MRPHLAVAIALVSCLSSVLFHVDSPADQAPTTTPRRPVALTTDTPSTEVAIPTASADSISEGTEMITADFADVIGDGPRFYGVEYGWIDQDEDLYLERYRRLHGNVVRVQISQELFEPVNDNDDPGCSEIDFSLTAPVDSELGKTMTYERMFKALVSEFPDMQFQINIWVAARWNAANPDGYLGVGGVFPPRDYAEHREFIRSLAGWLVEDCGILPEHVSVAFVNEANLDGFFAGTQAELVRMAEETRAALDQVSPLIQMAGLDEVHGTSWTDAFYQRRPDGCCDMWTFHVYQRGLSAMTAALKERTDRLSQYGPVWVTEFADTNNGSPDAQMDFSTREAALGFAEMLGALWPTEIDGIVHFRLSDTYADLLGGWVGHGLFADARGTHSGGQAYEPFPAYWVFANMFRELGDGQIVETTAPSDLTVVAARKESEEGVRLAVWVTNPTSEDHTAALTVNGFPAESIRAAIFDNMAGDAPVETRILSGDDPTMEVSISRRSSYLYVLSTATNGGPKTMWLPTVLKRQDWS